MTTPPPNPPPKKPVPKWVRVSGFVIFIVTLLFFIGLTGYTIFVGPVPEDAKFFVVAVLALGMAGSFGFVGGSAMAEGKIPLPGSKKHPVVYSIAGGVAVFLIVFALGMWLYPDAAPTENADVVRGLLYYGRLC